MIANNPSGYLQLVTSYDEVLEEHGSEPVLNLIEGTNASLIYISDNSWEGPKAIIPYQLNLPFDAQHKAAVRISDIFYCYNDPAPFRAIVDQHLIDASIKGGIEGSIRAISRPLMVKYATELDLQKKRWFFRTMDNIRLSKW